MTPNEPRLVGLLQAISSTKINHIPVLNGVCLNTIFMDQFRRVLFTLSTTTIDTNFHQTIIKYSDDSGRWSHVSKSNEQARVFHEQLVDALIAC